MKTTTQLRQLLKSDSLIVAPFILNAFHAKIAASVGLNAVYMTGSGTSAERGFPDVGLLTMTEMVSNAKYIAGAVDIPVICDADTGYGNPLNVQRTIREYEAAGVAGVHIEDQLFPKKCGFFAGKQVIPHEEAVQKIKAALDARVDPDFVIIARTNLIGSLLHQSCYPLKFGQICAIVDPLFKAEKKFGTRLLEQIGHRAKTAPMQGTRTMRGQRGHMFRTAISLVPSKSVFWVETGIIAH